MIRLNDNNSIDSQNDSYSQNYNYFLLMKKVIFIFRVQAVAIGQALVDAQWLEGITSADQIFQDEYALYKPGEVRNAAAIFLERVILIITM